jgi:hypothetical protein
MELILPFGRTEMEVVIKDGEDCGGEKGHYDSGGIISPLTLFPCPQSLKS